MNNENKIPVNSVHQFVVPDGTQRMRVDLFISQQFPNYTRSFIAKLFEQNLVTLNKKACKPGNMVKPGNVIDLTIKEQPKRTIGDITTDQTLSIIAKEDDFLIIYKPAGLIVHPPTSAFTGISLADLLVFHHEEIAHVGFVDRPGIVHRLDADTSGLLIVPLTNQAHANFTEQFKERTIKKTYYALVHGHPQKNGSIAFPVGRHQTERNRMCAFMFGAENSSARDAYTAYEVEQYFKDFSLVKVKPTTGRTHQIRVHMKAIGHTLLGDGMYGAPSKLIKRHALHAFSLEFTYAGKDYYFECPLDDDMKKVIAQAKPLENLD